jgi:hypothetical protein
MIDPGALGTLIIGLEADRRRTVPDLDHEPGATGRAAAVRPRTALATVLSHLADLLEPRRASRVAPAEPARSSSGDRR